MSEDLLLQVEHSQQLINEAFLGAGEYGGRLVDAYRAAIEIDPTLAHVEFRPFDETRKRPGAVPAWESDNGNHQIFFQAGLSHEDMLHTISDAEKISGLIPQLAKSIGIDPEQYTPKIAAIRTLLHELGHVADYHLFEHIPETFIKRAEEDKQSLPVPGVSARAIITEGSEANVYVREHQASLFEKWGVQSISELASTQSVYYRAMRAERQADNFVGQVIAEHPEVME